MGHASGKGGAKETGIPFQQKTAVKNKKIFDGHCNELEGHIFDCG